MPFFKWLTCMAFELYLNDQRLPLNEIQRIDCEVVKWGRTQIQCVRNSALKRIFETKCEVVTGLIQGPHISPAGKCAYGVIYSWHKFLGTVRCFLAWLHNLNPITLFQNSCQVQKLLPGVLVQKLWIFFKTLEFRKKFFYYKSCSAQHFEVSLLRHIALKSTIYEKNTGY